MRVLISALSCNTSHGSEALMGFKRTEALTHQYEVTFLASPPSQTPAGATLVPCNAAPCSFTEVTSLAGHRLWRGAGDTRLSQGPKSSE
jgi:hypothetical protein